MAAQVVPKQKIVICGGGNAAHIFCGLSAAQDNDVHLLSLFRTEAADFQTALNKTSDKLLTIDIIQEKKQIKSKPSNITNDPTCLNNADIVIISLPAFAHAQYLNAIKTNVKPVNKKTLIAVFPGASGLECEYLDIFGKNNKDFVLLSCITLPWAARIVQYGQKAEILGTKNQVEVCLQSYTDPASAPAPADNDQKTVDNPASNDNAVYISKLSAIIGALPVIVDNGHILNMSLSAINAIVHPSIMYGRWKDYDDKPLDAKPLFYQGITVDDAKLMSDLSDEIISIIKAVELETKLKLQTQHIFDWYKQCYGKECTDTSTLYKTIQTNPGYNGLTHPMTAIKDNNKTTYVPNWKYRYLSEDLPYGLIVSRGLSLILDDQYKVAVPVMDKIIQWSQLKLNKEYLKYNADGTIVAGKDIGQSRAPQRYNIKSILDLI